MLSSALPYHTTLSPSPSEGDRCAQCDRVFELGDLIVTYPARGLTAGADDPVRFAHFHEGCATMIYPATAKPVIRQNTVFHRVGSDSKATAA